MMTALRDSAIYAHLRPHVPDSLRHLVNRVKKTLRDRLARDRDIDFGFFALRVNNHDHGGTAHEAMYWHELSSPWDKELVAALQPQLFVDIGANYGYSALLHHALNPAAAFVVVEANPTLIPYIQYNLSAACCSFKLVNAVCSAAPGSASFSIHPSFSQDSRVVGLPSWRQVDVEATTLDSLLSTVATDTPIYVKIDTQGFEEQVFSGGQRFLAGSNEWVIQTECAPHWLLSQGTDPVRFLEGLLRRYAIFEIPHRARFKGDSLAKILAEPLVDADAESFVEYISGLACGSRGYCDLLVLPRQSRLLASSV